MHHSVVHTHTVRKHMTRHNMAASGDEVRRKPEPTPVPRATASNSLESFDILVLGRTGMGKSSTVEKLLVPNRRENALQDSSGTSTDHRYLCTDRQPPKFATPEINHYRQRSPKAKARELDIDSHRDKLQCENLTAWVLSDDEDEQRNADLRLKNVVYSRKAAKSCPPHFQIDYFREDMDLTSPYSSSKSCELLVNNDTNIRIVDTPGLFSPNFVGGATNQEGSHLAIFRHVVRIQAIAGLRFHRVLYFLPMRGPLHRDIIVLHEEIQHLVKFFGRSVFKRMVLIATERPYISKHAFICTSQKFPKMLLEQSRSYFREALEMEFKERQESTEELSTPPIIFIEMTDTCEEILDKVMSARVESNEGLELVFNSNTCSHSSMEIAVRNKDLLACEYQVAGDNPWASAIPYNDSRCHPISRVTAKSFAMGIFGLFRFKWRFTEERCINQDCKKGPGSCGCMLKSQAFNMSVIVDHTTKIDRERELELTAYNCASTAVHCVACIMIIVCL